MSLKFKWLESQKFYDLFWQILLSSTTSRSISHDHIFVCDVHGGIRDKKFPLRNSFL